MAFLLFVTFVPAVLLLVVQVMFSGSFTFFLDHLFLLPAITLFSAVQVVAVATAMLALSSLSRSSRYVGVLYAGLIFFSQAIYGILYALTRDSADGVRLDADEPRADSATSSSGLPLRFQMPLPLAILAVALLIAAPAIILERRVRGIEVVA